MSLVADYSSCSDEDNISDDADAANCLSVPQKLPSATLLLSGQKVKGLEIGVFTNPYKQKEDDDLATLEHHVKMVNTNDKIEKNGKKICWNYRKGRCRFGSNCSYYHDSDLITTDHIKQNIPSDEIKTNQKTKNDLGSASEFKNKVKTNKKRPGLSDSIVPSKKVMKAFYSNK